MSSGSSRATSTASAPCPARPARPACCHTDATVPGHPVSSTASSPATSTPSSSAFVAATPEQRPALQPALEVAPLLGQVAGAVGGDPVLQLGDGLGDGPAGRQRDRLGPAAGAHEGQRAGTLDDEVGQQVGGLGRRRAADRRAVLAAGAGQQRRLPEGELGRPARRAVPPDRGDVEAGEPGGRALGVGGGRRGQHEHRVGAVARADPAQPAQHLGDVGAEDPAVGVALVDDDPPQPAEEPGQVGVPRQHPAVQHVRVGEQQAGVPADPVALLARGVPVVGRRPHGGQARARGPRAADRWPAPSWARGTGRLPGRRRAARRAPAGGTRATCRWPCRWPAPPSCRPRRGRRRAPGAPRARVCRPAPSRPTSSSGTHDGQGTVVPVRAGTCSTCVTRPARDGSASSRASRPAGTAAGPGPGSGARGRSSARAPGAGRGESVIGTAVSQSHRPGALREGRPASP